MNFRNLFCLIGVLFLLTFYACNPYKKAQGLILDGRYDYAVSHLIKKYKKGVRDKHRKNLILTLKEAYSKGNQSNLETIKGYESSMDDFHKTQNTFYSYRKIVERQNDIKPLLPISINNKEVEFEMIDYSKELNESQWAYASELNKLGEALLQKNTKEDFRSAFDNFSELKDLYPNYSMVDENLEESKFKGTTFVFLNFRNSSDEYISYESDNILFPHEMINGINGRQSNWIKIQTEEDFDVEYEFDIIYDIQDVNISSDKETIHSFSQEKNIFVKNEFVLNSDGEIKKDSLGRKEMVPVYELVTCCVEEINRSKEANVILKVTVFENFSNKVRSQYFENTIVFEDSKATFTGDTRALEEDYINSVDDRINRFPSDETILRDCLDPLKTDSENYIRKWLY